MEHLGVFDAAGRPLDPPVASIDVVHAQGLWHKTFACWLVSPSRKTVVLQKRGVRNRIDPGFYDASASGHLAAGETPEEGWRELREELGVVIPDAQRFFIGMFLNRAVRGNYINNEFCHVFLACWQGDLSGLRLQDGEVEPCVEAGIGDALALFGGKKMEIPVQTENGRPFVLRRTDMCNHVPRSGANGYYYQVMQAAADVVDTGSVRRLQPV
jgi:ADP-ribose pyrophosphatase YjhB (NUDIX family)